MSLEFSIFETYDDSKDLRIEYPELADEEVFKDLTAKEVRFCWLVGNRTSPFAQIKSKEHKIQKAATQIFGESPSKKEYQEIFKMKIPERIKAGIIRMSEYNPTYRLRAKLMNEYMFDQIQDMIFIPEERRIIMDTDDKKKHTELLIKINSELPAFIRNLESGYGVKIKKSTSSNEQEKKVVKIADLPISTIED